ncbi:hypothetical protein BN2537_11461 [Streptomyces venezuelae]|nr:hypothetical protein BN2537_11461 [Streptomyces venezuelae]
MGEALRHPEGREGEQADRRGGGQGPRPDAGFGEHGDGHSRRPYRAGRRGSENRFGDLPGSRLMFCLSPRGKPKRRRERSKGL